MKNKCYEIADDYSATHFFGFGKVCYPWGKPEQLKLVKAKQHVADY